MYSEEDSGIGVVYRTGFELLWHHNSVRWDFAQEQCFDYLARMHAFDFFTWGYGLGRT
jgi:hypothetical protein